MTTIFHVKLVKFYGRSVFNHFCANCCHISQLDVCIKDKSDYDVKYSSQF